MIRDLSFKESTFNVTCGMKKKNENLTHINASFRRLYSANQRLFSTLLSKITKYNRVHLRFDPSVARLLGHDPIPRPTCPVTCGMSNICVNISSNEEVPLFSSTLVNLYIRGLYKWDRTCFENYLQ